jgi:CHAT domain-containing protein
MPQKKIRQFADPLRILIIISNPKDQYPLDPDKWEEIILESIASGSKNDQMVIRSIKCATFENISDTLLKFNPDILQFVGHGTYSNNTGYLALVNKDQSGTWLVDDASFADIFLGHDSRLGLVCLASCDSAKSESPQNFLGVAPKLVQRGIPAVVAMQYPILISSAGIFLENFYKALAARKPIDWAVQHGRNSLAINVGRGKRDFATPVLYMRAKDGKVF